MKIKNSTIVNFYNSGLDILGMKIPRKLYTALSLNIEAMQKAATIYEQQRQDVLDQYAEKDAEGNSAVKDNRYVISDEVSYRGEMKELQDIEVDLEIQTVPEVIMDMLDEKDKFDALTGVQYSAISFMVTGE